mmetsp:Transcript_35222/g.64339  ORF Transcript_35222/g.64339 Transcript_35222/m.64339 type:complete len:311 (-) Transcript_35222:124-1056(-)
MRGSSRTPHLHKMIMGGTSGMDHAGLIANAHTVFEMCHVNPHAPKAETAFILNDLFNSHRLPMPRWSPPLGQQFLPDVGYSKFTNAFPTIINHSRIRCGLVGENRYEAKVSCGIPLKEGEELGRQYVLPLYAEPSLSEARTKVGLPAEPDPVNASQARLTRYIYGQKRQEGVKLQHILMNTYEPTGFFMKVMRMLMGKPPVKEGPPKQKGYWGSTEGWRSTKSGLYYPVPVSPPKGKHLPFGAGMAEIKWKPLFPMLGAFYAPTPGGKPMTKSSSIESLSMQSKQEAQLLKGCEGARCMGPNMHGSDQFL